MLGVILASIGAFFTELSSSIAKREVSRKRESVYAMGFLNSLWEAFFFFVLIFFFRDIRTLTLAAWPTFLVRVVLSVFQAYLTVHAIAKSDRSTFGFIRTGTIPLLLLGDVWLGNLISPYQALGMLLIGFGLLFLYMNHGFSRRGIWFVVAGTVNAALTIGLYKYNITHGNSVEIEQFLVLLVLLAFFYVMSRSRFKEQPLRLLRKPLLAVQAGTIGASSLVESFAYVFAPASVILAASRSSSVIFSVLSGRVLFHETHVIVKILSLVAFVGGIICLAIG
ncbi:hypothetical protein HY479_00465 [Candidatus Uhrbacteria bacterium]|nr:hypothetical protein [Candidatus Uhrbacteria bacterium]